MAIGREYIGHFIYVLHFLLPLVQITESLEIRGDQQIGRPSYKFCYVTACKSSLVPLQMILHYGV